MSNLFWSGEPGQRLDFGPFDTTGIIDGTTIDSVTVRVRANEGPDVDWDAQVIDASLREVTASVVTDGLLNATPGIYRFSCFFWSSPGVLAFAADQQTVRFTERSVDFPALVPPYFGWEARIADAEAAADAALAEAGHTYEAVRAIRVSGPRSGLLADGVTLTAGHRVLDPELGTTAGIWLAAAGAWTRATDMAAGDVLSLGGIVPVLDGTAANVGLWLMSAPTTGTATVGTTALSWAKSGSDTTAIEARLDALETTAVAEPVSITMDRNQSIDLSGTGATLGLPLAVQLSASGHVNNTSTHLFVGAYTRPSVAWSDDMHVTGEDGSAFVFDPDQDLVVEARHVFGVTVGTAKQYSRATTFGPQIMLAICPTAQADTIELRMTKASKLTLSQISLTGSMAVARTPTAIKSGNGTTRIIVQLSGALASSDVVSIVLTSTAIVDLSSRAVPAQTLAVFWYSHPTELAGFTSYRDAQVGINAGDGSWVAPTAPAGGPVDATIIAQVNAERLPASEANRYAGAAAIRTTGIPVTANQATDVFTVAAGYDLPVLDTPIMLICGPTDYAGSPGSMPTGLSANVVRYAVNVNSSARTFQLSATIGGAAVTFTGNGNDLYILFQALWGVTNMSSLVAAATDTCWTAFRANRISIDSSGAPYNRQSPISSSSVWGWSVDKGAGADTCVLGANGLDAGGYISGADVAAEEAAPMLARRRHAGGQLYIRRDRLSESAGVACGNFTSLSGSLTVGARVSDMQGACDSDTFCYVTTNSAQTAQMNEGVESFFTLQPWGRFLRHDLVDMPRTLDAVVGRTARLYWNQVHESAGGPSQYTYAVSGGGATDANGWSMTPVGGDVGTRTITIVASLGGRPVATRSFTLNVLASATTGTARIVLVGDSWMNGFTLGDTIRANLVADGLTVTVLGSRGGRVCTVNATTNVWTSNGHGYTDNEPVRLFRSLNAGVLPTAVGGDLAQETYYYIEYIDANTFGLRRAAAGARIDVTSTGTGTMYICADDERNDGRGGWKWGDWYYSQSTTEGVSPFRDPATGLFSYSYYRTTYLGGLDPHAFLWQLGVNGSTGGYLIDGTPYVVDPNSDASVEAMLDLSSGIAERVFREISAVAPSVKHVLLNPSLQCTRQSDFRGTYGYAITQDNMQRVMHALVRRNIDQFAGREADGIYLASGAVMDRTNDYSAPDAFHPPNYTKPADSCAATLRRALAA